MPKLRHILLISLLVLGSVVAPAMNAAQAPNADLEREYSATVQPFLNAYCVSCHTGEKAAAQLDLRQYSSAASVVQDFAKWDRVREKLAAHQMPPKQAKQPPEGARQDVINWIAATWKTEARRNDGDPGPVLARRLSNAEYNYTIHDLTGVDIRPAREFPVDPANLAGFDNSGESLTMSPALLTKYLQAARQVADHMYLNPEGFEFAPHPMLVETDREKYCIQQIVDFYDRQATDYSDYFRSAWLYKHRAVLGKPKATLADIAAQNKVSARYLTTIWQALEGPKEEVGPLAKLQTMWRALPVPQKGSDPFLDEFVQMRDFVVRMRKDTSLKFASPVVKGLSVASQPLMNWKNRQYATHRRDFERAALRVADEPPPVEVKMPDAKRGLDRRRPERRRSECAQGAGRAVPVAHEESRSRGARRPARPLRGGVREVQLDLPRHVLRARARPLLSGRHGRQGTPAERRLPQRDGLHPRRCAAQRAAAGREGTERAGGAVGRVRVRRRLHGAHLHRVLLQPERRGARQRPRVRQPSSGRQGHHGRGGHSGFQEGVSRKGRGGREEQSHRLRGDHGSFRSRQRDDPTDRAQAARSRAAPARRAARICGARVSPAADAGRARRPARVLCRCARRAA